MSREKSDSNHGTLRLLSSPFPAKFEKSYRAAHLPRLSGARLIPIVLIVTRPDEYGCVGDEMIAELIGRGCELNNVPESKRLWAVLKPMLPNKPEARLATQAPGTELH